MTRARALLPPAATVLGPGLVVSLVIAAAAAFLADHYSGPVMLFALLLGMAMNFLSDVERCRAGIAFASRTLLRAGVALLGFRITLWQIAALGWQPVALVIALVSLTILASIWVARWMGYSGLFGLLTGGATAICGASAAAAISAALPPDPLKERNTLFTLIDDVAQVVGAGYAISPEAGDTATVVKLMRVAMLLPVIVATTLAVRARGGGEGERPPVLPWFLAAFLALVAINSLYPVPAFVQDAGSTASRWCLVTAIAALGIKTHFSEVIEIGWKPVALMIFETLFIAALGLVAIASGWV
jgi:uncharacterized membrane protein YadS